MVKLVQEVGPADARIQASFALPHCFSTPIGLDVYFHILIVSMLAGKLDTPEVVAGDMKWLW